MHIEIKVAVTPLVKAFLRQRLPIEPYMLLSQDTIYGTFLFNVLTSLKTVHREPQTTTLKKRARRKNQPKALPKKPDQQADVLNKKKYTDEIVLRISEDTWSRGKKFIPPVKQIAFNRLVLDQIDELFYNWTKCCVELNGWTQTQAFFAFRDHFKLSEDELTLKNMEQKYLRQRRRMCA